MRDVEVMADIPLPPPPPIYYRLTADDQDAAVQCDYIEEPPELLPPPVPIRDLGHHTTTMMLNRSGLRLDQLRDEVTDSIGRLVGTNSSQDRAIGAAVEFRVTMVSYMAQDLLESSNQHFSHWPDSTPATILSWLSTNWDSGPGTCHMSNYDCMATVMAVVGPPLGHCRAR